MNSLSKRDIEALICANSDELYAALGAAAVSQTAVGLLNAGREGTLYCPAPPMLGGGESPFVHTGLKEAGEAFFCRWASDIRDAICNNDAIYAAEKKDAIKQVDVWIATLVASLTVHIPALAGFTVILNLMAVIVARSGLKAFCQNSSPSPIKP